jgi:histidine triad (HIT) family protein
MTDCVFCKIIDRTIPGFFVSENEHVAIFISLEGHPLIVPKKHVQDIFSLDEETGAQVMKSSIELSHALKRALACDGTQISQRNGAAAGQDVFHYHLHVYPRWADGRILGTSDEARKETAEKIGAALRA